MLQEKTPDPFSVVDGRVKPQHRYAHRRTRAEEINGSWNLFRLKIFRWLDRDLTLLIEGWAVGWNLLLGISPAEEVVAAAVVVKMGGGPCHKGWTSRFY